MPQYDFLKPENRGYNPLLDPNLSAEEKNKYVYDPPKSDEQKKAERQKMIRDEAAKAANLNQYLQNGMSLEEQEREVMKKYAPYLAPRSTETIQFAETRAADATPDPANMPPILPYTEEQMKQMQTDPGAAMLYTGGFRGYNPYGGYVQQPNIMMPVQRTGYTFDQQQAMMAQQQMNTGAGLQYYQPLAGYQQPYMGYSQPMAPQYGYGINPYLMPPMYNGYSYAYSGGFNPQAYQQYMNEEQQRQTALREEQLNIMSVLISGARSAQGIQSTREEVKKELIEPPQLKIKKAYESRKVKVKTPGFKLMRGDEVLVAHKAEVVEYTGESLFNIEKRNNDMQIIYAYGIEGNTQHMRFQQLLNNYFAQRQQKYPANMTIEEFWDHYGSEMYQETIQDKMQAQQQKAIGLYDTNEYSKVIRQFMKTTNPYGFNILQNAFVNTNNGYVNMSGPVSVNDLEVSLPNHLRSEHDRRRAEFMARLLGGNSQVPVSGP